MKPDSIIAAFNSYCSPHRNITYLHHCFIAHKQKADKLFDDFITDLKKLSLDCEFGGLTDSLVRDIIVVGIRSNGLRDHLLREPSLSLDQADRIGLSSKEATHHMLSFESD